MTDITTELVPVSANDVVYRSSGDRVYVFWTPRAETAATLTTATIDDLNTDGKIVLVAEMARCNSRGAHSSGWVIRSGFRKESDPIPHRCDAIEQLRLVVADYFNT